MKTLRLIAALAVLLTLAAGNASRAEAADATANATATVVAPIAIQKDADLDFGEVAAGNSPGTVVMSPAGNRSAGGGATLGGPGGNAASFTVSGAPTFTYAITLPTSINIDFGMETMVVDNFTSDPSGTGAIGGGGTQTLNVGATLNLGANQAVGTYSGTFMVTVAYN